MHVGWWQIPKCHCKWLQFWDHPSTSGSETQVPMVVCDCDPGSKLFVQIEWLIDADADSRKFVNSEQPAAEAK